MDLSNLGKPDVTIAALKVWVHGREFENSQDYWDGNWLRVTANCAARGASVTVTGPIIHLSELVQLLKESEAMYETLSGSASLRCMEPALEVRLVAGGRGHVEATIEITPDPTQKHSFTFEIDQSYLSDMVDGCRRIVEEYPARGDRPAGS